MPAYSINNTAGTTVATIGVATTTGNAFPIELVGQGISLYGPIIAATQYHMLENFTSDTPPANPVKGMIWYAPTANEMNYHNGTSFVPLSSGSTNAAAVGKRLPSATGVDLTATGITPVFTDPNDGSTFHATGILLKVNGTPTATAPAMVNLMISNSEDVLEGVLVNLPTASKHAYYAIQGTTEVATGGATINLEVTSPASGGTLLVDVYLFGFTS